MLRVCRLGEGTRVAALYDVAGVHVQMASGASKLVLQMAPSAARVLSTELHDALPPGEPSTKRPAPPRYREQEPTNYAAVVHRMREGRATQRDAETIAHLLQYLGVRLT